MEQSNWDPRLDTGSGGEPWRLRQPKDAASIDAWLLLSKRVDRGSLEPTPADCWLLDAMAHLTGQRLACARASAFYPDAKEVA